MDISKKDKAEVLAALYNNSIPLGLGYFHYDPATMTVDEARELLKHQTYFDYLKGRIMKVDLSKDDLETRLYNRDNGDNEAEDIINNLRDISER